jgi:hypothetical protein
VSTQKVIPWVVRRSNEHPDQSSAGWTWMIGRDTGGNEVKAIDCKDAYRDEDGWLWMPAPDDPDGGTPEWTQVHPTRQRRCMDEGRCQVCGQSQLPDELVWLPPAHELKPALSGLSAITYTPPVCPRCAPVARAQCPHLRRTGPTAYRARRVLRWGVLGDIHEFPSGVRLGEAIVRKFDSIAPRVIARQRAVRLVDLKEVAL